LERRNVGKNALSGGKDWGLKGEIVSKRGLKWVIRRDHEGGKKIPPKVKSRKRGEMGFFHR